MYRNPVRMGNLYQRWGKVVSHRDNGGGIVFEGIRQRANLDIVFGNPSGHPANGVFVVRYQRHDNIDTINIVFGCPYQKYRMMYAFCR